MADYITKVNTDKLRETSDKMKAQQDIMQACMEDMKKNVDLLTDEYFKSEAGRLYKTKYTNVTNNLNSCLSKLTKEITAIRKAADMFEQGERTTRDEVMGLIENKIFINS